MALVACKGCAKEINTETSACPACGTPLPKADKSKNVEALTLIIALLIVVGAIYLAATKLSGI